MKIKTDINLALPAERTVLALVAPNRIEAIPISEAVEVSHPSRTTEGRADYVAKEVAVMLNPRLYHDGDYMPEWDTVEDWEGDPILVTEAVMCPMSDEWFHPFNGIEIRREGSRGWESIHVSPGIEEDIYECEYNGNYYHCDDTDNIHGQIVSHEELHENWYRCESCGDWVHPEDSIYRESRDATYCLECDPGDDTSDSHEGIFYYTYKPSIVLYGTGDLKMGVELEVEAEDWDDMDEAVHKVYSAMNGHEYSNEGDYVYLKEDGSLGSYGFEIVTQPASLEYHQEKFGRLLDEGIPCRSYIGGSCGCHVHIGRGEVNDATIANLYIFMNHDQNRNFLRHIAKRYDVGFSKKKNLEKKHYLTARNKNNGGFSTERYEFLNLLNRETIEFRIFRGNLKKSSFLTYLEFVDALVRFMRQADNLPRQATRFWWFVDNVLKSQNPLWTNLKSSILDGGFDNEARKELKKYKPRNTKLKLSNK